MFTPRVCVCVGGGSFFLTLEGGGGGGGGGTQELTKAFDVTKNLKELSEPVP